jgi:hypothetical protein
MKASELLVNADSVGEPLLDNPYHSSLIDSNHSLSENHMLLLENFGFFLMR